MDQIRNIVVPIDFSVTSRGAIARAVTLARLDEASVHLVHAIRFPLTDATAYEVSIPAALSEGVRAVSREKLEEAREAIPEAGVLHVTLELSDWSDPVRAIAAAVESKHADLVVMGTHGRTGLKHAFLGSVAERTLRTLDCPILVVKEDPGIAALPITRILVAVDFSIHSDFAVETATTLAKRLGAALDVVHAFDLPGDYISYGSPLGVELERKIEASAGESLNSVYERLKDTRLSVHLHCQRGRPSVVISEVAEKTGCQMIVMGTRGNTGLSHVLLGSVAERTLRKAPCSVLTVTARKDQNFKDAADT